MGHEKQKHIARAENKRKWFKTFIDIHNGEPTYNEMFIFDVGFNQGWNARKKFIPKPVKSNEFDTSNDILDILKRDDLDILESISVLRDIEGAFLEQLDKNLNTKPDNTQQGERARTRNGDRASDEVMSNASQCVRELREQLFDGLHDTEKYDKSFGEKLEKLKRIYDM